MNITVLIQSARARREIQALRAEIKTLEAENAKLRGQLADTGTAAGSMFNGGLAALSRWGSGMQWAGRQLTANFTLPVVAAGTIFTKWVLDFESAMTRIQKVYGDAATGSVKFAAANNTLRRAFEALSVRYAISQTEVAQIAGDWAAAGATGAALAKGVETTLKTMTLGEFEAAEATEALISIQAQWGASSDELIDIINRLNATENATGITFQGLVQGLQRSSSTARDAGVDINHLAAMLAALTPASGSAAQSGNALKTMISRLLSPTKDAAQVLGLMGLKMDDVNWKSLNASQRLELLAQRYHDLGGAYSTDGIDDAEQSNQKFISSQAAVVSSVVASRYQINRFSTLMRDIYYSMDDNADTNGYYGRTLQVLGDDLDAAASKAQVTKMALNELNVVLNSSPKAVERAGIVIQNSFMKVISSVLPQIIWMVNVLATMTERFSNLNPYVQKFIMGMLALLAVIGPPLVILGSLAVAIARVGMLFGMLQKGLATVSAAFGTGGTLATFFSGALGKARMAAAKLVPAMAAVAPEAAAAGAATGAAYTVGLTNSSKSWYGVLGSFRVAWRAATTMTIADIAAANTAAAAASAKSAASAKAMAVGAVATAQGIVTKISLGFKGMATSISSSWATANAATATAMTRIATVTNGGAGRVAAAIDRGWVSANSATYIALNKMQGAVYGAYGSFQRATQRTFMENLAVINSYVTSAIAAGARMGAGVTAAAQGAANGAMAATAGARATVARGAAATGATATAAATLWSRRFLDGIKGLPARIAKFFTILGPLLANALKNLGVIILRFFTGPWGLAITAVVTLLLMFKDQIAQLFQNIGALAKDSTSPFGKAWEGVVNLFNQGVEVANKAFHALPEGVQDSLTAVVTLVKNAAMKVYEWFSYINPFARHSPSLVENVTNGMEIVGQRFGLAANVIKGHMLSAYSAITKFGQATAGFMSQVQAMTRADERASIAEHAPQALAAYDQLNAILPPLRADLEAIALAMAKQEKIVNGLKAAVDRQQTAVEALEKTYDQLQDRLQGIQDQMTAAQDKLDEFSSTGIKGQRAMSDAIFENEMAQKKLRLEILRLEQAGESVEDLRDRLASLQGDIEDLRANASDLRAAGAGSDILGPIDAQIAAMEAQYKALSQGSGTGADAISDLQNQLEELQTQGEILDLENSIKFDPLTRQIEQLTDGYKELPFGQIVAGIKDQQAELAKLQPQYDAANAAVEKQQTLMDAAKLKLDNVTAAYDAQKNILDGLQTTYDAVEQQIRDTEDAITDLVGAADEMQRKLDEAKRASEEYLSPGAQNFLDAAGGSFEDYGGTSIIADEAGDLDAWLDDFLAESGTIFDDLDLFGPIREKWEAFKGWWSENVSPIFSNLWEGLKEAAGNVDWGAPFTAIGDWWNGLFPEGSGLTGALSDWWERVSGPLKEAFSGLGDEFKKAWDKLKPSLEKAGEALKPVGDALLWLWDNVLKPVGSFLGEWIPKVLGGAIAFIAGLIGGIIIVVSNIISNVIGPIIQWISDVFSRLVDIFTGIITFITGVFTLNWSQAWDGIRQIFAGIWNAIYAVVSGAIGVIWGFVSGLVEGVVSWFEWLYDVLVGNSIIPDMVNAIIDWFVSLKDKAVEWVKKLWNGVVTWFTTTKDDAIQKVKNMRDAVVGWFVSTKDDAIQKIKDLKSGVVTWFTNTKTDAVAKVKETWSSVVGWFGNLKTDAVQKIKDLKTDAVNKFIEVRDSLIEKAKDLRDKVMKPITEFKEKFLQAFRDIKDSIGNIWEKIEEKFAGGINNGPIKAINGLIKGINKLADVLPGLDFSISLIPELATGGAIPKKRVGAGFATTGARAIVGEGNPAHPEYVIPTDPRYRARANELYDALGKQLGKGTDDETFAIGGPIDSIRNWITSGSNALAEGGEWLENMAKGAASTVLRPFKKIMDDRIANMTWRVGKALAQGTLDKVWGWATNADEAYRQEGEALGGKWRKPINSYSITSRFGPRSMFGNTFHAGIDLAGPANSSIFAANAGKIVKKGFNSLSGRSGLGIAIQHLNNVFTYYGHLSSALVKLGQQVVGGQKIGVQGATGNVTGPHLHFETQTGRLGHAINPSVFMKSKGIQLAAGGIVQSRRGGTLATIGEAGRDEAVIPLPTGWKNIFSQMKAFSSTGSMRIQNMIVQGNVEGRTVVMPVSSTENKTYNFYGDLSFPNIKDGDSAEDFIRNLEDLAGGR